VQGHQALAFDQIGSHSDAFASVELILGDERCDILSRGDPIATMNTKTHVALKSLSYNGRLKYTGKILRSDFNQSITAAARSPSANARKPTSTMSILVCGPRSIAEDLANDLSRYRLFLQHPYPRPADIIYDNPQYFDKVGSSFSNGAVLAPIGDDVFQQDEDRPNDTNQDDGVDVAVIMDNLPGHEYLKEASVDPRINAKLLKLVCCTLSVLKRALNHACRHQREAIDFVLCREEVGEQKPASLWRPESLAFGHQV
jgi:SWI/SNF-related matrix-associated actin-dependent regulator of chromatin subfamily A3